MVRTKNLLQFGAAEQAKTVKIHENGIIRTIVYVCPNYTTAVSGVLTLKDTDGHTIYTSGTINDNTTTVVNSLVTPIDYDYTITFTLNAASGDAAPKDTYIKLYIEDV